MASVKYTRELAQLFGEKHIIFLSQDGKARVLIGLPVLKKQEDMLIHLPCKVSFLDHDFRIEKTMSSFCLYKLALYSVNIVLSQALFQPMLPSVLKNVAEVALKAILTLLSSRDVRKQSSKIRFLVLGSIDGELHEAPRAARL